jgi:hypothetical protein
MLRRLTGLGLALLLASTALAQDPARRIELVP